MGDAYHIKDQYARKHSRAKRDASPKWGKAELAGVSGGAGYQCTCAKGHLEIADFPYIKRKNEASKVWVVD